MSGVDTKKCWAEGEKVQHFILTVASFLNAKTTTQSQGVLQLQYTMKIKNAQRWWQVIDVLVHLESKRNDNNLT